MKGKHKIIIVLFLFLISTFFVVQYMTRESITISGKALTIQEFEDVFVNKKSKVIAEEENVDTSDAELQISKVSVKDKKVKLQMSLREDNKKIASFYISGTLYEGYRGMVSDASSLVLDGKDSNKDVQLLLFEMVQGSSENNFFTSSEETKQSALRIYIQRGGKLYFFEEVLPEAFFKCFEEEYDQMTDAQKDFLWFYSFLDPILLSRDYEQEKGLEAFLSDEEESSTFWSGDTLFQAALTVNGNSYVQEMIPFGYYRIPNAGVNDSSWHIKVLTHENTKVNEATITGYDNDLYMEQVKISVDVGEKTEIQNSAVSDGGIHLYPSGTHMIIADFSKMQEPYVLDLEVNTTVEQGHWDLVAVIDIEWVSCFEQQDRKIFKDDAIQLHVPYLSGGESGVEK